MLKQQEEETEKYVELCKEIVLSNIDKAKYAVFLFGSRARVIHGEKTDIDIGFLGDKSVPQKKLNEIKDKIDESIVPFNVDLIDFFNVNNEFKAQALKNIIVWNKPSYIKIN